MSHDAYRAAQKSNQSPRDTEYRAFTEATRRLIAACEKEADFAARARAVHDNRQLWGALADDCARGDNALPPETRAGIISLSLWVVRFSKDALRTGESLEPLIDINKTIMAGLSGKVTAAE